MGYVGQSEHGIPAFQFNADRVEASLGTHRRPAQSDQSSVPDFNADSNCRRSSGNSIRTQAVRASSIRLSVSGSMNLERFLFDSLFQIRILQGRRGQQIHLSPQNSLRLGRERHEPVSIAW